MDTEPFDEVELLALPASPVASPPRRLKRLKKSSSQTTTTTTIPPAGSPPLTPPPPATEAPPGEETLAPIPSPLPNPSPRPPTPPDADAATPLPHSSPAPDSSPLPPTDPPDDDDEEEDDGLDPLFSETVGAAGWDPLGAPAEGDGEDEEDVLGGGLIEELRRESSAKKRLDMDDADGEMAAGAGAKGKRSKRKRKDEAPKESAREKKRSEKERRAELDSIHAESQRLLRETRSASFKPIVLPVYKPISSVLEKIRLRKLEILKKSNATIEDSDDNDMAPEPVSDSAVHLDIPPAKEVTVDDKGGSDKELGANGHGLDRCDNIQDDGDGLNRKEDTKASYEKIADRLQENHEENAQSSDNHDDPVDQTQLPSSSPNERTDETLSEDEEEDNDKENMDPSTQNNDVNTHEHLQRATGGDLCPDDAILKDFLDDEAEEEDDSDNDMNRFRDNEEDDESDENEVLNDLIAAGYEEKELDHKKRNELHQKWLQQQDAAETNNVMQRLKFGHQEHKESVHEDEDEEDEDEEDGNEDIENCGDDLTPKNIVKQNTEKAKEMITKMFADDNDTYEHSDDEEIEEHLARQRISKREVDNNIFISPLEDDNSREVFSLIKKLNIAPQPKGRGKQSTSSHEMLMTGRNSSASKSSFLGRSASGSLASCQRSVHRSYVFGRDDSNSSSKSCMTTSESNSDMDQANSSQPKKAKFSCSQPKPRANSEFNTSSGVSLFEILRRTSQEQSSQESCNTITESQAVHQFSAFKLSRRFSKVGARN